MKTLIHNNVIGNFNLKRKKEERESDDGVREA